MTSIPFYVINLDRDIERWNDTKKKLSEHNIIPIRISAVDGKQIKKNEFKKLTSPFVYNFGSNSLIGCALSHMKTWEYIEKKGDNYAVIMEDDILVRNTKSLATKLDHLMENYVPKDFDICYLGCHGKCDVNEKYKFYNEYLRFYRAQKARKINDFVYVPEVASGAYAYLVSRNGIKKLLKLIKQIEHPIDMQMSLNFDKLNVYVINPILVDYNRAVPSNMITTRPTISKLLNLTYMNVTYQKNLFYYQYKIGDYPINLWVILLLLTSIYVGYIGLKEWGYFLVFYLIININTDMKLLMGDLIILLLGFAIGNYL